MNISESKLKHGIADFEDGFVESAKQADEALVNEDVEKYIQSTLRGVRKAFEEIEVLQSMEEKSFEKIKASQFTYEMRHRETFIESRLIRIYYNLYLGEIKYPTGKLNSEIALIIKEFKAKRLLKYVKAKAKNKYLSGNISKKDNLAVILENEEDGTTECKQSFLAKEAISKTLTAFANTKGGKLFIGIAEKSDLKEDERTLAVTEKFYAIGVFDDIDSHRARLTQYIEANTTIDVSELKITLIPFKDKTIVQITVPAIFMKTGKVSFFRENAFLRVDNHNKKLTPKELYGLLRSYVPKRQEIKGLEDIRKIDVYQSKNILIATAFYNDGTKMENFKGYWFGWQQIPGKPGLLWTPIAYGESKIKKPNNFTEIHVYKYEPKNSEEDPLNTRGTWIP